MKMKTNIWFSILGILSKVKNSCQQSTNNFNFVINCPWINDVFSSWPRRIKRRRLGESSRSRWIKCCADCSWSWALSLSNRQEYLVSSDTLHSFLLFIMCMLTCFTSFHPSTLPDVDYREQRDKDMGLGRTWSARLGKYIWSSHPSGSTSRRRASRPAYQDQSLLWKWVYIRHKTTPPISNLNSTHIQ